MSTGNSDSLTKRLCEREEQFELPPIDIRRINLEKTFGDSASGEAAVRDIFGEMDIVRKDFKGKYREVGEKL